jgi:hypothetical protein
VPEDVQTVAPSVIRHRLRPASGETGERAQLVGRLLGTVPIP